MDSKELRNQSVDSLQKSLKEAQDRLQELRFEISANQLKDVREVREVRKAIARINTILSEMHSVQKTETPAA